MSSSQRFNPPPQGPSALANNADPTTTKKLNAAGMSPENSMVLPEREAHDEEERRILDALREMYAAPQPDEALLQVFAHDVIYSSPRGDVFVGHNGLRKLFSTPERATRKLQHRLLRTPDTLPAKTMLVDQVVFLSAGAPSPSDEGDEGDEGDESAEAVQTTAIRSLLVLKRRQADGLVSHMTEEEGHRRATAPLAARAASASNFYSPTDNMVSPCTSKLNLAKRKHHAKAKPTNLFASQLAQNQARSQASGGDSDMDF